MNASRPMASCSDLREPARRQPTLRGLGRQLPDSGSSPAGDEVLVSLDDDAPGTPNSEKGGHFFARPARGGDAAEEQPALGLSIAGALVRRHGGRIRADDRTPSGYPRDRNPVHAPRSARPRVQRREKTRLEPGPREPARPWAGHGGGSAASVPRKNWAISRRPCSPVRGAPADRAVACDEPGQPLAGVQCRFLHRRARPRSRARPRDHLVAEYYRDSPDCILVLAELVDREAGRRGDSRGSRQSRPPPARYRRLQPEQELPAPRPALPLRSWS